MTVTPVAPPANFNLAVETLKRTLRQDKVAASILFQAQEKTELTVDETGLNSDLGLGRNINTDA